MVRKNKIAQLFDLIWEPYVNILNAHKDKGSAEVIKVLCEHLNITLINGGLPEGHGGRTDGKSITISFRSDDAFNIFIFFHEYAHYHLHFNAAGRKLSLKLKEQEADAFALLITDMTFPNNYEKLLEFSRANPLLKSAA